MMDALLIVAGGLLGSAHCVGMCGGFVLTLGSAQVGVLANVGRQLLYAMGRVLTYVLGGALVGFGGWQLEQRWREVVPVQALLALLAGALLLWEGMRAAGLLRWVSAEKPGGCPMAGVLGSLLRARGWQQVFSAGVLNGLLPCGLVYAYLALASSSRSMTQGMLTMALFGLGTIPALLLTGIGGHWLSLTQRTRVFRIAAWCMILTAVLTLGRAVSAAAAWETAAEPACPMCQ